MQEIEDLGADIEHAWSSVHYQASEFASIAQVALEKRTLPTSMSTERICRWFALSPQIPHQPSGVLFGEPPIQLYAGRRFYIEVLFWTDGTTAIHQHSFSGAFQVLLGGSIHTTYTFECQRALTRELLLGNLTVDSSELLRRGDVRQIVSGDRFIHSLFHLERPSVTLVVRTKRDAGTCPQYSYFHPGIAYDPFIPDERPSRLLQLLDVLDQRSPEATQLLAELIGNVDLGSVVAILMHWFRAHPVDPDVSEPLLAIVARRHDALAASLRRAIQEARRQALILNRRRGNHHVDHRFFLALLLNVGDRTRILQFVRQQYPGKEPIEHIITWIEDLRASSSSVPCNTMGTGPIGYDLGEAELEVLRSLLRQQTPEQIVAALNEEYEDVESQRTHILELCVSLTNSALFRPLFSVSP
jgi:hypothetical protein